jgi:hypothetical protein
MTEQHTTATFTCFSLSCDLHIHFASILGCLKKKYSVPCLSKAMPSIRQSLNQKCRDLRKQFSKEPKEARYRLSEKSFCETDDIENETEEETDNVDQ